MTHMFHKRRYTNGQQVYFKNLSTANGQENDNQSHNEISPQLEHRLSETMGKGDFNNENVI